MRSSLKKSLYLGLAALSFASVAGVATNAATASAKKTTKHAKKHVKKHAKKAKAKKAITIKSLVNIDNQSSSTNAVTLNNGTLTNRPDGVKGSKSSATGISNTELFMKYQEATLSNGKKYYKVVSFTNPQHRGFVEETATSTTPTLTVADNNQNLGNVYLKYPGAQNLYTNPAGSTYKKQITVHAADTYKLAKDAFGVNQIATLKNGDTAYHVVDLANPDIQGWVSKSNVTAGANRYFNKNTDVMVNFVNNGKTVASQMVNVANNGRISDADKYQHQASNDRLLNKSIFNTIFSTTNTQDSDGDVTGANFTAQDGANTDNLTDQLAHAGYFVSQADLAYSLNQISNDVKLGDSININVTSNANTDVATSSLKFKSIAPVISGNGSKTKVEWNPADAQDMSGKGVQVPASINRDDYNADFQGNKKTFVGTKGSQANGSGLNNIFLNNNDKLFGTNGPLTSFYSSQNANVLSTSQYTNGHLDNDNGTNTMNATDYVNNNLSGMVAFNSDQAVKDAANQVSDTKSLADIINSRLNNGSNDLTFLKIGQQFHMTYVIDRQATMQYNAWATLYGQPITVIYDAVPVATAAPTTANTTNTNNGIPASEYAPAQK